MIAQFLPLGFDHNNQNTYVSIKLIFSGVLTIQAGEKLHHTILIIWYDICTISYGPYGVKMPWGIF